ncbi:MAG: hypothetical protein Q4D56_04270 [Bacteroides sp.]|nr:hypothetical protein [Bacteroides sp.]
METATPNGCSVSRLARLNKDLDNFYELLYSQWQSVTKEDYNIFGQQLNIMLRTLKELVSAYKKQLPTSELSKEVEKLGMNYAALQEVNNDIVNFKIKMPQDTEMKELMKRASMVSKHVAV